MTLSENCTIISIFIMKIVLCESLTYLVTYSAFKVIAEMCYINYLLSTYLLTYNISFTL